MAIEAITTALRPTAQKLKSTARPVSRTFAAVALGAATALGAMNAKANIGSTEPAMYGTTNWVVKTGDVVLQGAKALNDTYNTITNTGKKVTWRSVTTNGVEFVVDKEGKKIESPMKFTSYSKNNATNDFQYTINGTNGVVSAQGDLKFINTPVQPYQFFRLGTQNVKEVTPQQ